jgi:tRNA(Ile)-lysidine synthase
MPQLEQAGLTRARIASAAGHLTRAREALETVTAAVLARAVRVQEDAVQLDAPALAAAPREVGLRALAQVLMTVSGRSYRPRFERLERLFDRICADEIGRGATLHGCKIWTAPSKKRAFGPGTLVIAREFDL